MSKLIDLVVPCFNEEAVLPSFYEETRKVTDHIQGYDFRFILVDDGSRDKTLSIMRDLAGHHTDVIYISFSRNFGKEAAMYAGLQATAGDYVIVMDADLQHPPAMIPDMIKGVEEGYDCVAARRTSRTGEGKIKSFFSSMFYRFSNHLSDVKMAEGAVDFRIMSRQMIDAILSLGEVQRFSKGIFMWVGFDTKWIPYENVERTLGETKWKLSSLWRYALDGITSFSTKPLAYVSRLGLCISLFAFFYIIVTLIKTLVTGIDVPGYTTTLCAVLFLGGIIEFSLGVVGNYIARIYTQVKDRPIYITKETNLAQGRVPLVGFSKPRSLPSEPQKKEEST